VGDERGSDQAPDPVALHPERTADPRTLRWQVVGRLLDLGPEAFDELVDRGVLTAVTVGPDNITTTLAVGRSWADVAVLVRSTVAAAVAGARSRARQDSLDDPDAALSLAARRVIDEEISPYAAGHGGGVELRSVHDGVVEVALAGACRGCPIAPLTVQGRLAGRLRAEAPWLDAVRIAPASRGRPAGRTRV